VIEAKSADDAEFEVAFAAACTACIAAARRLKPRLLAEDDAAALEFGRVAGDAMAKAGATAQEGHHYMHHILASVMAEPQA
jgi:hypothetical protein